MNSYQNSPGDSRDMQKHSLSSPSPSATTVEAAPPTSSSSYGVIANHYVLGVAFYSFLGFTLLQTAFALRARSSAMIADSIAMYVDAFTYLCNLLAERLKDRKSMTEYERQLTPLVLKYRRKMQTLYLELIPPMISVTILLIATIITMKGSIHTLMTPDKIPVDPNLKIMMVFSVLNLFVDCLNVAFFARTDNGLQLSKSSLNLLDNERRGDRYTSSSNTNNEFHISEDTETSHLVTKSFQESFVNDTFESTAHYANDIFLDDNDNTNEVNQRNLNMCSAFTVSNNCFSYDHKHEHNFIKYLFLTQYFCSMFLQIHYEV